MKQNVLDALAKKLRHAHLTDTTGWEVPDFKIVTPIYPEEQEGVRRCHVVKS